MLRSTRPDKPGSEIDEINSAVFEAIHRKSGELSDEFMERFGSHDSKGINSDAYIKQFKEQIMPLLSDEQLFNITRSLMRKPISTQPLLRGVGQLSGFAYVELARRLDYNPYKPDEPIPPGFNELNRCFYQYTLTAPEINEDGCASTILNKVAAMHAEKMSDVEMIDHMGKCQQIVANISDYPEIRNTILNEDVRNIDAKPAPSSEIFSHHTQKPEQTIEALKLLVQQIPINYMAAEDAKKTSKKKHIETAEQISSQLLGILNDNLLDPQTKITSVSTQLSRLFDEQATAKSGKTKSPIMQGKSIFSRAIPRRLSEEGRSKNRYSILVNTLNKTADKNDSNYSRLLGLTLRTALSSCTDLNEDQQKMQTALAKLITPTAYSPCYKIAEIQATSSPELAHSKPLRLSRDF